MNIKTETGRNDPCPCGSGKKYKKCCLQQGTSNITSIDFAWRTLRQTEGRVMDNHLIPYAMKKLPKAILEQAMEDFMLDELPDEIDKEHLFVQFFIPWFLFSWISELDFDIAKFDNEETIAQNYLQRFEFKLNSTEKRFINAMHETYYSFYSVLSVEPEKSLMVKDMLLGTLHTIKEKEGTKHLKRGDIIFSRIITIENQSIFAGMAPLVIPASYQTNMLDFRDWLIQECEPEQLSRTILREDLNLELFDYFFGIIETVCSQKLPKLTNTDDDPFLFSTSYFKLTMRPEEALNYLLPLTFSEDPDKFLSETKCDKKGVIEEIELPWLKKGNKKHKSWDNTVMGHIIIKNNKLTLETNSEKRAKQGQKLLKKYLGEAISFQQTVFETPEQKLASLPEDNKNNNVIPKEEVMKNPEMLEKIQEMAKNHWKSWFDKPIPALNDQTPREAAKTAIGRERLEALLIQYERFEFEKAEDDPFKADFHYLRTELALID